MRDVLAFLDGAERMYRDTANAWSREGIASCAALNDVAALAVRRARLELANLHAREADELGLTPAGVDWSPIGATVHGVDRFDRSIAVLQGAVKHARRHADGIRGDSELVGDFGGVADAFDELADEHIHAMRALAVSAARGASHV